MDRKIGSQFPEVFQVLMRRFVYMFNEEDRPGVPRTLKFGDRVREPAV